MSVGGEPGHLHPRATQRSSFRYGIAESRIARIPNEEITWAGESPWTGGYCFGAESGKVFFCSKSDSEPNVEYAEMLAEDAINGIAFWNEFIGVSTRSEVVVYRRVTGGAFDLVVSGPGGAHGVLATPGGQFLAPSGPEGVLCVDVAAKVGPRMWNQRANGTSLNHYSLTRLGNAAGKEILACAGRTDGLSGFSSTRATRGPSSPGSRRPMLILSTCARWHLPGGRGGTLPRQISGSRSGLAHRRSASNAPN